MLEGLHANEPETYNKLIQSTLQEGANSLKMPESSLCLSTINVMIYLSAIYITYMIYCICQHTLQCILFIYALHQKYNFYLYTLHHSALLNYQYEYFLVRLSLLCHYFVLIKTVLRQLKTVVN